MKRRLIYFLAFGFASEVLYLLYKRFRRKKNYSGFKTEVLFFPDKNVACKEFFTATLGCEKVTCGFSHDTSSLSRLYQNLSNAKESIDVCVYVFTSSHLASVLIDSNNKGVHVRLITDSEQCEQEESQIWRLRSEGVQVRHDESSFFMHHKFVIIDNKRLINGSFNWTRQAVIGNQENLIITEEPHVVQAFMQEFTSLWEKFNPQKRKKLTFQS
ncbi:hypothetical protein FSP39_006986 [Pinctada imbricata]|uniref:Mitochondrial cardiolipin hydrolase n=2 Tax=Pinctada TaxID=50425 RepID=A0AA88XXL0_PINIB|nr:hypothetical protein FSP39_006986 [Pinctada imbricata]QKV26112.1 mitochondrial cardiolipin hydrolase [Pinctada fucata]